MKPKEILDSLISQYVRKTETKCFTCGKSLRYEDRQAGHYIPRGHSATRYMIDNIHTQCENCNCFLRSNHDVYRTRLIEKIGLEKVERLEALKRTIFKIYPYNLKVMTEYFKTQLEILDKGE